MNKKFETIIDELVDSSPIYSQKPSPDLLRYCQEESDWSCPMQREYQYFIFILSDFLILYFLYFPKLATL